MRHHPWKFPVLSGILFAVGHYTPLLVPNFVSFLPMLVWIDAHRERPLGDVARGGIVFGLVTYGIGMHWIYAMLSISSLAILMYLGLLVLFTSGAALALTLVGWMRRFTHASFGLLLPACWIPFEWSRTWGDLRMTADHVGQGVARFPFLIQFADVVGPYGVALFLLAFQGLLYELVTSWRTTRGKRAAALLLLLVGPVVGYDGWKWTHPPRADRTLRVALIQPNIPLVLKHDPAEVERQDRVLAEMTREAANESPDLIVWPESARPGLVEHWLDNPASFAMPEVQRLAVETGASILAGAEYARIRSVQDYEIYNAALLAHPDGTLDPAWTAKVYLVPFTEGVPFRPLLGPLLEGLGGELRWLSGGFTPGPVTTLRAANVAIGILVCYEELYFDLSRALRNAGADLQVVITNDAWFGRTVFQDFIADAVRMRAIESRSSFVRAANTGISGFVDPLGRYHQRTGLFVPAVEVWDVPIVRGRTIYTRIGDVAAWLAIAALVCASWAARRGQRKAAARS